MKIQKYTGIALISKVKTLNESHHPQLPDLWEEIGESSLYVSEKDLIKYSNSHIRILLDGVIYRFRGQDFSEDFYEVLAESFSENIENTLQDLDGEFTIIIENRSDKSICLASGETGNCALFYHPGKNWLLFGNSLSGLKEFIPEGISINNERIYQILSGQNLGSNNTIYSEIQKLLPGNYLTISGEEIKICEYSNIFKTEREIQIVEREVYERFYEIFKAAILKRVRTRRIGIALSSGKDSVSVASMLASITGAEMDLFSYTSKPVYFPEGYKDDYSYDETILLKSLFERYPEIHSREVAGIQEGSLVRSFEQSLEMFGEPVYGASNQYWILDMHRMLRDDQCAQLFSGQGGNFTISWPPPELAFRKKGVKSKIKYLIRLRQRPFTKLPYLSLKFLSSIDKVDFIDYYSLYDLDRLQPIFLRNSIGYTGFLQKQISLTTGIYVTDPTVDKELVKFCLSIPYNVYHDKQNSRKLVNNGLRELIPESILQNRIRGIQASDIQFRIEREREQMFEKLVFFSKNKIVKFVFEIDRLIREWEKFDFFKMNRRDINHILRIFSVAMFLSKLED